MTILCPIDFSPTSLVALEYAVKIGEKHKAHLHLLYAFSDEEFNKKLSDGEVLPFDDYKLEAEEKLKAISNEIKSRKKGGKFTYSVEAGSFIAVAKQSIEDIKVDLVVIGTKGASDVMERMAGTNTIKMIESTSIPVLAVPKNANYENIEKVVYASDYAKDDLKGIGTMVDLFRPFDPQFIVLHMTPNYDTASVTALDTFRSTIEEAVDHKIGFYLKTYQGGIALGIDEFMMENDCNMLCILMEKHDLIERIFHKSVTLQLTYLMDFPMLILK